jgi:hypothetical protein
VSYIAQHSMHHLEENLLLNPITYIQKRFFQVEDTFCCSITTPPWASRSASPRHRNPKPETPIHTRRHPMYPKP